MKRRSFLKVCGGALSAIGLSRLLPADGVPETTAANPVANDLRPTYADLFEERLPYLRDIAMQFEGIAAETIHPGELVCYNDDSTSWVTRFRPSKTIAGVAVTEGRKGQEIVVAMQG